MSVRITQSRLTVDESNQTVIIADNDLYFAHYGTRDSDLQLPFEKALHCQLSVSLLTAVAEKESTSNAPNEYFHGKRHFSPSTKR